LKEHWEVGMEITKLKSLLLETPDTLTYNGESYKYTDTYNVCAFLVYYNDKYFGYSSRIHDFVSNDPSVVSYDMLPDDDEKKKGLRFFKDLKSKYSKTSSGGHYDLGRLLSNFYPKFDDYFDAQARFRVFEVPESLFSDNKKVILTAWYGTEMIKKYASFCIEILKKIGYDPRNVLYEDGEKYPAEFLTYDELFKGVNVSTEVETEITKEIKVKTKEYVEKMSKLHTDKATMSPVQLKELNREVLLLRAELEILVNAKKENKTQLSDVDLQKAILKVIHELDKEVKPSSAILYAKLEKQLNMPIAQIRAKFTGIPLDKLVKKTLQEYIKLKKGRVTLSSA
jgi:hypothetical protein